MKIIIDEQFEDIEHLKLMLLIIRDSIEVGKMEGNYIKYRVYE